VPLPEVGMDAWRRDLYDWQKFSNSLGNVGSIRAGMDILELSTWTLAKFGAAVVDAETGVDDFEAPVIEAEASVVGSDVALVGS